MRNSVTLKSIMNTIKKIDTYHVPVLLEACMEGMDLKPDGTYVDVTFGGGGHSRESLKHLSSEGQL
jgi:16S rRNA (cytosine1402-N4)-methyltransferase